MKIDIKLLQELAKIRLTEEEEKEMLSHIQRMIASFEKLKEVDVEGVEPLVDPLERQAPLAEDMVGRSMDRIDALNLAPDAYMEYFRAPSPISDTE